MDVTVITPTLEDRVHLLDECAESVENQTIGDVKHLYMIDKNRQGPAYIRNRLVGNADTEWVSFLDDDDLMMPDHLWLHSHFINDYDVVFSWGAVGNPPNSVNIFDSRYDPDAILKGHNTIPVTASVRTDLFKKIGGFPEGERFEDWALWKNMILAEARFKCIEAVSWYYRVQPEGRNEKE